MKKIFLLSFFLVHLTCGQGNPYDSLELKLSAEKGNSKKLELLKQLVEVAFESDMERALGYAKQGVQLAEKTGDKYWQPKFYEMEGRMYANLLHLDSATLLFNKALAGYGSEGDKRGQATTQFKIAWVLKKRGDLAEAMKADLKALDIMESLGDQEGMADALVRVSEDLTRQGQFTEAMVYARQAMDICEKNQLKNEMVYALTRAGEVEMESGHYNLANDYFNRTLQLARQQRFGEISLSDFFNNRGNALKRLGRYPEAVKDYNASLAIANKSNYANAISSTIANLGEVNLLIGNYKGALPYLLETVGMQEHSNDFSNIIENYLHLSIVYEHLGDYKSALAYHKKAWVVRDSIASLKSDEAMARMLTQYQVQKKEATIRAQEIMILDQRKVQWLGTGIVFLLSSFIIFGYISYRIRVKRNRLLASKNAENELLLQEIHHRVKNNLEVVSSLLALQSAQIEDPGTKEAMLEGQSRVHSIGIVHQNLYQGKNLGSIEMKDYFLNLSESILDFFGAEERVEIELLMEKLDVDIDTAVPLGLIVNELLTNTLKYAFPYESKGRVSIKLEKKANNILHLEVADNGIGKSGIIKGTGFGSQLIDLLTRQLSGNMREEIGNGTRFFFDFKMDKVA